MISRCSKNIVKEGKGVVKCRNTRHSGLTKSKVLIGGRSRVRFASLLASSAALDEITDKPVAAKLLDQPLVIWRSHRQIAAFYDLCIHRGTPLSLGRVEKEQLVCAYHGWHYASNGELHPYSVASAGFGRFPAKPVRPRSALKNDTGWFGFASTNPSVTSRIFPRSLIILHSDGTVISMKIHGRRMLLGY